MFALLATATYDLTLLVKIKGYKNTINDKSSKRNERHLSQVSKHLINQISSIHHYQAVIEGAKTVFESGPYGFQEMMPNLIEEEQLYKKSLGVTSDIVLKEMYTV